MQAATIADEIELFERTAQLADALSDALENGRLDRATRRRIARLAEVVASRAARMRQQIEAAAANGWRA